MRYLPQTNAARKEMLETIGVSNVDDLFVQVPKKSNRFFLGAGVYYHHVPSSVDYIIQRSEFLTAYTPYQPEIAQGTLQYLFEFQTFIAQITGQEVANASLYDGATSMGEAALMAMRVTRKDKICYGNDIHPQYEEVTETYLNNNEGASSYKITDPAQVQDDTACVFIQSPDFYGAPHSIDDWRKAWVKRKALAWRCLLVGRTLAFLLAVKSSSVKCQGVFVGKRLTPMATVVSF